jgi:hypothetical protein
MALIGNPSKLWRTKMKTIILALLLATNVANAAAVDDATAVSLCNAVRGDAITFFKNLMNGQTLRQQMAVANKEKEKGVRYLYKTLLNTLYNNTNVASYPAATDFGADIYDTCHTRVMNGTLFDHLR